MYYDFTRPNVQYRRDIDLPNFVRERHNEDLGSIQALLHHTGIIARIDFAFLLERHQTHLELETFDGCIIINMTGSFFFDAHLGIWSIDGDFGTNQNLARIAHNLAYNRSWTGAAELVAL